MKKLMIVAAAAAMTFAGYAAGLSGQACSNCGSGGVTTGCDVYTFKVTGSGKAVVMAKSGAYKTIGAIRIKKGGLALQGTVDCATGVCCYDTGDLYATFKVGSTTYKTYSNWNLDVWSVFGKNLEASRNYREEVKKGGKISLDSAIFMQTSGTMLLDDGDPFEVDPWRVDVGGSLDIFASAFGKVEMKVSKENTAYCNSSSCDPVYTPKNYAGYFVGYYDCIDDEDCFACTCGQDVLGGTWKAVFKSVSKSTSAAESLGW